MFEFVQDYINPVYIIAVVFVTEGVKKFWPGFMSGGKKKWLTAFVAFVLSGVFIGWHAVVGVDLVSFSQKILLSFPGVSTFYDYLAGPIIDKLKPKPPTNAE